MSGKACSPWHWTLLLLLHPLIFIINQPTSVLRLSVLRKNQLTCYDLISKLTEAGSKLCKATD